MSEVENTEVNPGEALFDLPGAPTKVQVEEWKQKFGEVFCSGFSGTEVFVFRPLQRQEFVNLQVTVANAGGQMTQFQIEEDTVKRCTLWASTDGEKALVIKAGTLSALHEQILQNSNFVNPSMASVLVVKL